jgi:hypothetical protein
LLWLSTSRRTRSLVIFVIECVIYCQCV